jgi:hypothetical protein
VKVTVKEFKEIAMKVCNDCFESKPLTEFYLWCGKYYRAACNPCKNKQDHQRVLTKKLNGGDKSITNCSECGLLCKKVYGKTECVTCRRKLGLITGVYQ